MGLGAVMENHGRYGPPGFDPRNICPAYYAIPASNDNKILVIAVIIITTIPWVGVYQIVFY